MYYLNNIGNRKMTDFCGILFTYRALYLIDKIQVYLGSELQGQSYTRGAIAPSETRQQPKSISIGTKRP